MDRISVSSPTSSGDGPRGTPGLPTAAGQASRVERGTGGGSGDHQTAGVSPGGGAARAGSALPGGSAVAIALVGVALGLAATALVIGRDWDPGAVAVGPWMTRPRVGTTGIDPYARADLARSGAVPMAASEGLSFTARTDDTGYRLLRSCTYTVGGGLLPARFWTLTATGDDGAPGDDPARRSAFASTAVVRDATGAFAVEIGPEARPGNWLPVAGSGSLTLTLRLYGTPLTAGPGEIASAHLPSIARRSCTAPGATTGQGGTHAASDRDMPR